MPASPSPGSTAGLVFRPATAADYPAICGLINDEDELFLVHPRGRFPLTEAQLTELATQRRGFTVGECRGEVVAFANFYDFSPAGHAFIGNLVVAATQRRRGLGRRLVEHMLERAREDYRLAAVRISVFADNTPALLLYGAAGFVPCGMEERRDPRGRRRALLHMEKCLTPPAPGREADTEVDGQG